MDCYAKEAVVTAILTAHFHVPVGVKTDFLFVTCFSPHLMPVDWVQFFPHVPDERTEAQSIRNLPKL